MKIKSILIMILIVCTAITYAKPMAMGDNTYKQQIQEQIDFTGLGLHVNLSGLENAMVRVRNNATMEHLGEVLNKIQRQTKDHLMSMQQLQFRERVLEGNATVIEAVGIKKAKLLYLFKFNHEYIYNIDSEGSMERVKRFRDIFWKDLEDEDQI